MTDNKLKAVVVGAGYWGPNLARNFRASADWELAGVCDLDEARAQKVADSVGGVPIWTRLDDVLADPTVDAVAIATPARTHHPIALAALDAGKHVMVEKPLADTTARGEDMVARAEERGLVLMADHTYCYTPAVLKIREIIADGGLGDILFVDSTRINLGLIQPDVDVFWDLAPHDLSIMDFVLPGGLDTTSVSAHGSDPLRTGKACVGYLAMPLACGAMAHVNVNWLSPTKIRQMVIGGTKRTLVWDDLNPQQRISVYDRGVDIDTVSKETTLDRRAANISYRLGDTWSPALDEREALGGVVAELAAAIRDGRPARTSGEAGMRVLSVLDAAQRSLAAGGAPAPMTLDIQPQRSHRSTAA